MRGGVLLLILVLVAAGCGDKDATGSGGHPMVRQSKKAGISTEKGS